MRKNIEISKDEYRNILEDFYSYFTTGYAFEEFLKVYLSKIGLDEVSITQRSRDGGIDLIARRNGIGGFSESDETAYYVQAKRNKPETTVPVTKIRELKGTIPFGHKGIFITTAKFSSDAKSEANNDPSKPVILVDGRSLIDSCIENEIGFLYKPVFSKTEMKRFTETQPRLSETEGGLIVEKTVSANDIRARILRLPRPIEKQLPPDSLSYIINFHSELSIALNLDKTRTYFGGVSEIYRKYGLINSDGAYTEKKAIWTMKPNGNISIVFE